MQQFISNIITLEEVEIATTSTEDNKENEDIFSEIFLSNNAQNCTEEQGTSSYTPLVLSPQQMVSLKQSAEDILGGIKKNVEVQYLIPATEKSPSTGMYAR
jgi:hypothetical protein